MKKVTIFLALLLFVVFQAAAQMQITGTVTGTEDGLSIPGVSVVVKGNPTIGTTTDIDGKYSLSVPSTTEALVFSFVGMKTQEEVINGRSVIDLAMETEVLEMDEVVVTALGIKREKKALGYSVGEVGADQIQNKPEIDIASSLTGKVAGVNIVKNAGVVGAGSSITIRGMSSINGSNQPLFVVDGIPFDAGTNSIGGFSSGGGNQNMFSSRFLDIDPNNIESVNVLKGLNASALYGEQGKNGVIIITTKTGSGTKAKGLEVNVNQSFYLNQVANLPDYQNTYGQGGNNAINVGYVGNWGGKFSEGHTVRHHYNQNKFASSFPEYQDLFIDYEAVEDNVKDFFQDGYGKNTYVGISNGFENGSLNFNVGYTDEEGMIPMNEVNKLNLGVGGDYKVDKFKFSGSMNYAQTDYKSPPFAANNANNAVSIMQRLWFIPRNLDLNNLPYEDPFTGENVYYRADQDNPYWLLNNSGSESFTKRFYGNAKVSYDITDFLSVSYQAGLDTYNEEQNFYINKGGVSNDQASQGFLRTAIVNNTIWNHNAMMDLSKLEITSDIDMSATIGVQIRMDEWERTGIASTQQVIFDIFRHDNFESSSNIDPSTDVALDRLVREEQIGAYGQMTFDYRDYVYLTLNGRNDWTSTVEKENRSLFYPGISMSFLPTSALEALKGNNNINFMKVRAAYATSAGFPPAYSTRDYFSPNPTAYNDGTTSYPSISMGNTLGNPNLKPELHKEYEFGFEGYFFNHRVDIEATVYYKISDDQIVYQDLDPSTGYDGTYTNLGRVDNKGVEINLGIVPVDNSGFRWKMDNIFTAYRSEVVEVEGEVQFAGFSNLGNFAIKGEPLGVIKGNFAAKDDNGNYLINAETGTIIDSEDLGLDNEIIGNPNPDWKWTTINTLSYKGITLSAQLDYTHGGDFYGQTITQLLRRGVTKDTEDRDGMYVIPGVLADPNTGEVLTDENGNPIQNNIQLGANEVYFLNFVDPSGQGIFDGSVIRLREISVGYDIPSSFLDKTPFTGLTLMLSGQNLWYHAPNVPEHTNFDPETLSTGVGNGMGLEFGATPSAKKFAFTLKVNF